jgi:hypothetical protein
MPKLNHEGVENLNKPMSNEIQTVIKYLPTKKIPSISTNPLKQIKK